MDNLETRIKILRELLTCVNNIFWSEFDAEFVPVFSNAIHKEAFHLFFSLDDYGNAAAKEYQGKPYLRTNSMGMVWISDVQLENGSPVKYHVLGPVFLDDYSRKKIESEMNKLQLSIPTKRSFMEVVRELPIITLKHFYEYGIMLHYCLTNEKVTIADFYKEETKYKDGVLGDDANDLHGTYEAEQEILRFVEEGNINYKEKIAKLAMYGRLGKLSSGDYLQEMKQHVMIFIALCCRAAIKGGLDPETAYQLSDMYIQSLESCFSLDALTDISHGMLDDYINRVHKIRTDTGISPQIQTACDYLSLNLDKKINIHELANRIGYADYYFTKKFKKEIGMSVADFMMEKRIAKAKELLKNTNISIQDIANQLTFGSPSYFAKSFLSKTGMTPGEYRLKWMKTN